MCGIIGYTGKRNAQEVLMNGLKRLEYRGYDSAGVAIQGLDELNILKRSGKLSVLQDELKKFPIKGNTGIGHTRWATHGAPNNANAHPHADKEKKIAIVHNGIIENYYELKNELKKKGYVFKSETDSEVIAHLVSENYKGDLRAALQKAVKKLKGSYAVAAVHFDEPDKIVGARKDSPLIVGVGEGENFLASDIPAVLEYTKNVIYLENGDMAEITPQGANVYTPDGERAERNLAEIKWDISQAEKAGYEHFMLKEIFEQPHILRKIFAERIKGETVNFDELIISRREIKKIKRVAIVACGTAYHAGLIGKYLIEKYAKIPVWVDTSSEFRYRDPLVDKDTLVILISQSGETADTLAALREAKERKALVLAICNVVGSSISREADGVIYTHAGPEIAVASTKAYTAQVATLYLVTYYLAEIAGNSNIKKELPLRELKKTANLAENFLKKTHASGNTVKKYAQDFHKFYLARNNKSCFLYLARNINYPNALEGALKLKEISYISAEGYPAGEMKHGPIALIDENPWVVCIAVKGATYEKMLSNIQEIKARGGIVIGIVSEGDKLIKGKSADYVIEIPSISEVFSPLVVVLPLQLLAYYVAAEFGYDIDQPRNLAKSVTVE